MGIKKTLAKIVLSAVLGVGSLISGGCYEDNLAISPNNNDVAISLNSEGEYNPAKDDKDIELYVYRLKQGDLERLTNNHVFDGAPDFSPDGKSIVYISNDSKNDDSNIKIMNLKDKSIKIIAQGDSPDWSPKTDKISFLRERIEKENGKTVEKFELCVIDTKQNDGEVIEKADSILTYCWDVEGKRIFYAPVEGGLEIKSYEVDTKKKKEVLNLKEAGYEGVRQLVCGTQRYLALTTYLKEEDNVVVIDLKDNSYEVIPAENDLDIRFPKLSSKGTLSVSYGHDPWAIRLYENEKGKWVRKKEIKGTEKAGWWGNFEWFLKDGKENMLAVFGDTDSQADFYELHTIDSKTFKDEGNLSEKIKKEFIKLQTTKYIGAEKEAYEFAKEMAQKKPEEFEVKFFSKGAVYHDKNITEGGGNFYFKSEGKGRFVGIMDVINESHYRLMVGKVNVIEEKDLLENRQRKPSDRLYDKRPLTGDVFLSYVNLPQQNLNLFYICKGRIALSYSQDNGEWFKHYLEETESSSFEIDKVRFKEKADKKQVEKYLKLVEDLRKAYPAEEKK